MLIFSSEIVQPNWVKFCMVDPWGVATYAHEASTDLEDSHLQNQQLS